MARQVAVEFDHGEFAQPFNQGLGDGRQARANFHHVLARLRIYGTHN